MTGDLATGNLHVGEEKEFRFVFKTAADKFNIPFPPIREADDKRFDSLLSKGFLKVGDWLPGYNNIHSCKFALNATESTIFVICDNIYCFTGWKWCEDDNRKLCTKHAK